MIPTQKLYPWCLESSLPSTLDVATVQSAGSSFVAAGGSKVWVLDASGVQSADYAVVGEIQSVMGHLAKIGLERVGLILPPGIAVSLAVKAAVGSFQGPPIVRTFKTRGDAMAWLKTGCP